MGKRKIAKILNFIAEAGMLKRVKRSGWWVLGIKDVETVAEHSFRCAVLGYLIARMEKVDPYKVLLMTLFNDIQEARITDLHKMSQRYFKYQRAEEKAFSEQIQALPKDIKDELSSMHRDYVHQKSKPSIIARDADILECLIQAKEYEEHGHREAPKFMKKAPAFLKTKSAKILWSHAKKSKLNTWWENLTEFKR